MELFNHVLALTGETEALLQETLTLINAILEFALIVMGLAFSIGLSG